MSRQGFVCSLTLTRDYDNAGLRYTLLELESCRHGLSWQKLVNDEEDVEEWG
jgi:hypothetical protein